MVGDPSTSRSDRMMEMSPQTAKRQALTGTPVYNKPADRCLPGRDVQRPLMVALQDPQKTAGLHAGEQRSQCLFVGPVAAMLEKEGIRAMVFHGGLADQALAEAVIGLQRGPQARAAGQRGRGRGP